MAYLSIGEFARASGLTPKALRLYDELELLVPAKVDEFNGYRWYAPDQLERARLVASLRLIGMPLYRIRQVVALGARNRAAEIGAYWRQVEADHLSRRAVVSTLVEQLPPEEPDMSSTLHTWNFRTATRLGQGARSSQQDAVYAGSTVFAIADGIGDGDAVAPAAVEAIGALERRPDTADPAEALRAAVADAARAAAAGEKGTTLTALWFTNGQARTAHIGDCRLHRIRGGRVERLTRDHTLVAALVEEGRLTEDEARAHPQRSLINRALGADAPGEADFGEVDVQAGDRFAFTSDGVHSVVPPEQLASLLLDTGDPEAVVSRIADAVEAAGAPDNYSLVLLEVG